MLSAIWLVVLYNRMVNVTHGMENARAEIKTLQTQNSELQERIFTLFDNRNLLKLAEEKSLIKDRNPQYFEVDRQWSLASQY